jgi:hypothetical protein
MCASSGAASGCQSFLSQFEPLFMLVYEKCGIAGGLIAGQQLAALH